jgi:phosphoesterase RecJ-like protein
MNPSVEFLDALRSLRRAVLVSHRGPDYDAYSSLAAMKLILEAQGTTVCLVNADGLIDRYRGVPALQNVESQFPTDLETWDAVVVLDCGEEKRVGDALLPDLSRARCIVNIDHHISNPHFGHFSFVDPTAASTTELLYRIAKALPCALSPQLATALYFGLSADTGSFKYSSTSAQTLRMAAELVECGANPSAISNEIYGRNSLASVKAHALVLNRVRLACNNRVAIGQLHAEELQAIGACGDDTEGLVERLRDIDGVDIACFMREEEGFVKGSLRSALTEVDVAAIVAGLGGGGHRAAAGFRTKQNFDQVLEFVLPQIEAALAKILVDRSGARLA